jgi:hypothetical protein
MCRLWGIYSKSIYKILKIKGHYFKQINDDVFELIRPIIQAKPTYGYKRVTEMLNRQRLELGLKRYNKKRIYTMMELKGAILPKTEKTRDHQPTGVFMTLFSNTRRCSGGFEIKCFSEKEVLKGREQAGRLSSYQTEDQFTGPIRFKA